MSVRLLGADDAEQVWAMNQLAFGYRGEGPPPALRDVYGIDGDDGRLLGAARVRSYEQVWGGRRVPMGGIAALAVRPDARGQGVASTLLRGLLPVMREAGQAISALFPTGVGIYRPLGWEVVGSLDDTRIPTHELRPHAGAGHGIRVRTAGPEDVAKIAALYAGLAANGLLVRDGPEFPRGVDAVLEHDVVSLAESEDGAALGYATYSRGSGYREGSELRMWDFVARTGAAAAALLRSLASWSSVAPHVLWRGPTGELALQVPAQVPPPVHVQPWMLRIVDPPAAVSQRGFSPAVSVDASFVLDDPDVPDNAGPWRLRVDGAAGSLSRVDDAADLPVLHVRGLALAYAGAADSGLLQRAGLLDRPLPAVDIAFAGQPPRILDYF